MGARVGQERRRLVLSHGCLTSRGDSTSAIVTPGNAHLAANANPGNWVFRDQRVGSLTKGEPLRNVDGAVHSRAGPRLLEACQALPTDAQGLRCPLGEARATPGFELPAGFVIHTVGPRDRDQAASEPDSCTPNSNRNPNPKLKAALRAAHNSCLRLAEAKGIEKIYFPAISCG